MKKTLLACFLIGAATASFGQRNVGTATPMQPVSFDGSRATDTIYSAVFDDELTELAVYGVTDAGGYILGTNVYGDVAKAQSFLLDAPTMVEELLFWFGAKSEGAGGSIACNLYAMNGPGETLSDPNYQFAPGTILSSVDIPVTAVDTGSMLTFTSAVLPSPVYVGIEFAAGFDMTNLAAGDSVALVSSTDGVVEIGEQCWEKWSDGDWYTLPAAGWGGGAFDVDAFVLVVIDNNTIGIEEEGSMNHMRMSFLNGNISQGTVQLGYELEQAGRMNLLVHNAAGQVVFEQALGNQGVGGYTTTFSTDGWASGKYYVTLKNNGMPITKKLMVQ